MRTLENSKVEKTDYLIIHTDCQETRILSSTKSDDHDQFNADSVGDVEKLSSSPKYKEEFLCISDKTIDFHAKNLLSDSGTECSLLADLEEELTSLDDDSGTRSEGTDPDSEGQDERDSEDAEKENNDDPSSYQDGEDDAEDLREDSCDMTYIELDLSSQSNKDVSDDETCMELMMKNLKISVYSKFDSDDDRPVKFSEDDHSDSELDESGEKQDLNLPKEMNSNSAVSLIDNSEHENTSFSWKHLRRSDFFAAFLPATESGLCSLPERTYGEIVEHLLDEKTQQKLSAEEDDLFNSNPYRTTLDADDIPLELLSQDLECALSPNEMCPMTYVDLDVTQPCSEDLPVEMFSNLNINDDKSPLCRGNPSDQDGIQNHSLYSGIDPSDFEVPTVDSPSYLGGSASTDMDSNSFMDLHNSSLLQDFYSLQTYPSPSGTDFNLGSPTCLPTSSNYCITKTPETCPEVNSVEGSFLKNSFLSSGATAASSSFQCGISFFDDSFENDETNYENEYVTRNLQKLNEIKDILGLSNSESQNIIPPFSTPPSTADNFPPFPKQMCLTNHSTMKSSFPTTSLSVNSFVIPRVTTQTPGTQSDAIPAHPSFCLILSTSLHGMKRPSCIEMSEPAKKPFGYVSLNKSAFSEGYHRKKVKQMVEKLTEKRLLEFENNESCLHEAVRRTDHEYVLALLKRLSNINSHSLDDVINSKNEKSQTPLHLAVQKNIPAIVHLLIKYGAEVNHLAMTPSEKLEAPLHYVASQGIKFKLVLNCLLKAKDLDINIKNSEGQTALHCAALAHGTAGSNSAHFIDNEYIIKKLLTSGADPLIKDDSGKNVLMHAIESKEINLVSQIIKNVSNDHLQELLEATTSNEQTCLSLAQSQKEKYNEMQWEKLINMLTQHNSSNNGTN